MKRIFLVLLALSLPFFLFASLSLALSADAGVLQDFAIRNSSYNFDIDARCKLTQAFEVRLPVGIVWNNNAKMFDLGLSLNYYPFDNLGLFVGLSLIQFGFVSPEGLLSKSTINLNEVSVGWTFETKSGLFAEPSILIRDPSGTFSDEYSMIKGAFPCYKNFRARIMCGYKFKIAQSK